MKILSAELVISAAGADDFPTDGLPQIAMAGRSNAGKSSLINVLCQAKALARVSQVPGKTRLINFYRVNKAFYLVDLPGFGYAKAGPDVRKSMETVLTLYVQGAPDLRGLIYLVDSRVPDSAVDHAALEWLLEEGEHPLLVLASKADKLKKSALQAALAEIARNHSLPEPPLPISSFAKTGLDALWEQVLSLIAAPAP